jgi:DNA-binding transcriptional LysR family regulator
MLSAHGTKMNEVSLEGLRWFVRAAEAGSLSRAARQANMAQSTVSRALSRLEAAAALQLVTRTGRVFRLTEAGARLLPYAQAVLADVERLSRAAADVKGALRGVVRLSLCTTLGRHVLLPRLSAWRGQRTGVTLEVRLEESDVDPRTSGLDIVVRAGRPRDSGLSRTLLGDYGHVLVTSPGYARRRGVPAHPDEIGAHETVAMRLERVWSAWPFRQGRNEARIDVAPTVSVTDADALLDLACAGAGLTVLPDYLAAPALRRKMLVELLDDWALPRIPVHAFHAPTRKLPHLIGEALAVMRLAMRELARR